MSTDHQQQQWEDCHNGMTKWCVTFSSEVTDFRLQNKFSKQENTPVHRHKQHARVILMISTKIIYRFCNKIGNAMKEILTTKREQDSSCIKLLNKSWMLTQLLQRGIQQRVVLSPSHELCCAWRLSNIFKLLLGVSSTESRGAFVMGLLVLPLSNQLEIAWRS